MYKIIFKLAKETVIEIQWLYDLIDLINKSLNYMYQELRILDHSNPRGNMIRRRSSNCKK